MSAPDQLAGYLRDHRAGAAGGERLAQRCRDHVPVEHRPVLGTIVDEIAGERTALDEIMRSLDVDRAPVKEGLAVAGELAGRLKLNRRLVRRAPGSTVLELEMLMGGVTAKRQLWDALASLAASDAQALDRATVVGLREQADSQLARLRGVHAAIAPGLLGGPAGPSDDPR